MIENQRQYHKTQEWLERFQSDLSAIKTAEMHPIQKRVHEDSLSSMIEGLQQQLAAYDWAHELNSAKPLAYRHPKELHYPSGIDVVAVVMWNGTDRRFEAILFESDGIVLMNSIIGYAQPCSCAEFEKVCRGLLNEFAGSRDYF